MRALVGCTAAAPGGGLLALASAINCAAASAAAGELAWEKVIACSASKGGEIRAGSIEHGWVGGHVPLQYRSPSSSYAFAPSTAAVGDTFLTSVSSMNSKNSGTGLDARADSG
mmetsp:Transcript_50610/g.101805  ORF Transcript_50610/g.101805 Transcript_50610/m.101805 type:complete len:113 (-) Transcript_50610:445-783(-)